MAERKKRKTSKAPSPEIKKRQRVIRVSDKLRQVVAEARTDGAPIVLRNAFEYEVIEQSLACLRDFLNAQGAMELAQCPQVTDDPK